MPHVSPSQVETKRGCWRKWAYSRKRKRKSSPYSEFGDRVHLIQEGWLRDGVPPDADTKEGRCALSGLHNLPMPGEAAVELRFDRVWGGIEYTGRIDFTYGYEPGRIIVVGDHKTTGDLKWMAEKSAKFDNDPQRVIYSHWAAETFDVPYVVAHWQYYRRDGKDSKPLVMVENRETIAARFWQLHENEAKPMIACHGIEPEHFPRNLEHCNALGGCDYRDECLAGVSPIDRAMTAFYQIGPARKNKAA